MLPDSEGGENHTLWHTYYSNPNPAGGSFFVQESHHIDEYWPDTGDTYRTQRHFSSYFAIDVNKDGKSDMVKVWRKYFKPRWTINDHDTEWSVTVYTNTIGKAGSPGYQQTYFSGIFYSGSPDIPIPITSNYRYQGANTELVIVRRHYNKIEYYQFNKNVETDCRLKTVREANGAIVHDIEYLPMVAGDEGLGNPTTNFYSSSNTAEYPFVEIIKNRSSYLVSKLTASVNGVAKSQDFRYHGYISNFNYGTVGFKRTTRSSWYASPADTKIWTTSHNDPALRGANTITWTSTNAATVFNTVPDNLLSTKTNVFETYTNPVSKVYHVLLQQQTVLDALTNVKTEHQYTYDGSPSSASYYGLEIERVSRYYSGTQLQGTTTRATTYLNNPDGEGAAYYIGKPSSVTTTQFIAAGADIRDTQESYTYNGPNISRIEKTGQDTDYSITEEMQYDALGNVLIKTIATPQAPVLVAPKIIQHEYDPLNGLS